jgi:predicted dithiol-disulfide oxidoreductase (DUF899 family)
MQPHKVATRDEWLAARKAHLKNEKALTRMRDLVSAERRALPWVKVEKEYVFETTDGKRTLAQLFGANDQLIIHHFMWRWDLGQGCASCSLEADHAEGAIVHLQNHGVTYVRVSRAPLAELQAYSVFCKNDTGEVFHTYSSYARGNEEVNAVFIYLDITPKGRNEIEIMDWVKRHDEYDAAEKPANCCHSPDMRSASA